MGAWRELYDQMLEDMRSPSFRRFGSYSVAGRSFTYRSLSEFKNLLAWVKANADLEDGIQPYLARKGLVNGGRGYSGYWRGGRW